MGHSVDSQVFQPVGHHQLIISRESKWPGYVHNCEEEKAKEYEWKRGKSKGSKFATLYFVQFWQASGEGQNRIFLVAIKYLFVMSTRFIGCNSTTLAKLIALSTTQNSTKAYSREVPNSPAVEDSQVFFLWLSCTMAIQYCSNVH